MHIVHLRLSSTLQNADVGYTGGRRLLEPYGPPSGTTPPYVSPAQALATFLYAFMAMRVLV